ncbi:MAG: hypothetical protein GVY10_04185 [Verrucomicrobia bacterium]|nr:hypothetical protein [Verrucomicrobiota bacterium]
MALPPLLPRLLSSECLPDAHGVLLLPTDLVFRFLEAWAEPPDSSDLSPVSPMPEKRDFSTLPPLHLNLGIEGVEEPAFPIEENAATLLVAARFHLPVLPVLLSGEWERAFAAGLLSANQLRALQALL